jgi:hypothetical protein
VEWWKWALALPVEGHPFIEPGFDCNSANNGCTIPAHTAVFLGLPNVECSSLEPTFPDGTGGQTAAERRACATFYANHILVTSLFCTIDDQEVANLGSFRFPSSQFTFSAPTPWIFGDEGRTGKAISDGYFVMLKPPSSGTHTLSCGGEFPFSVAEGDPFDADFGGNTYHLTVEE